MALDLETAEQVVELLDGEGYDDIEVRESYSGRGMYGSEVVAFVADSTSAITAIGWAFGNLGLDLADVPTRTDSMGLGVVIY